MADTDAAKITELEFKAESLKNTIDSLKQNRARATPDQQEAFESEIVEHEQELESTEANIAALKNLAEQKRKNSALGKTAAIASGAAGVAAGAVSKMNNARKRSKAKNKGKPGLFHRAKNTYNSANNAFMNAQDNIAATLKPHHPWFFAIVALLIHAWDATNSFDVGMGHRTSMFIVYAVFSVLVMFVFYGTGFSEGSRQYIGISLFAWALPYLRLIPMLGRNDYFTFVLTIIPVWFLFIALHEPDSRVLTFFAKLLLFIYAVLLMLLLIFFVAGKDLLPNVSAPAATVGSSLSRVWTDIKDVSGGMWDRTAPMFNPTAWRQKINSTFNPKATLYAGQVEDNKREPHGVYITKLESLYPKTYVGTAPIVLGRIEAKTFIEGGLNLMPSCRLERQNRIGWNGTPDVEPPIMVNYQLVRDIMCTFPIDRDITPGTYNAYLSVSFDFETWAYITNTFVARDVIAQYRQQGKDINRELDINPNIEAIYTSGPVTVGMHSTVQPIDVDPDAHNPIQQRFGFTIDDRWEQGEFKDFYNADVLVPEPFELEACAPMVPYVKSQVDGIRTYRFEKNESFDPRLDARTVTCQLVLPSKEAALSVIGFGEKTPVTFVVIARYNYAVEKKTVVRIEE